MDLRNLQSHLTSSTRVQPKRAAPPTRTYLSIADSTTITFGNTMAMWVFEHTDESTLTAPTASSLTRALAEALSIFPQFAGKLSLVPWPSEGPDKVPHEKRFRRGLISYGSRSEPGVDVQTASLDVSMRSIFPDAETRASKDWSWNVSDVNFVVLFSPEGDLAGNLNKERPNTPAVRIRITEFACRNLAVAIKIAHPLADAESMIAFMKVWADEHRARMLNEYSTPHYPVFNPSFLDAQAAGDVDAARPDVHIVNRSKSLPLPWYDWWEPDPSIEATMVGNPQVEVPPEIPRSYADSRRRGNQIPWQEWDLSSPASHLIIRLSREEIEALFETSRFHANREGITISRHDVLLAFVWQLISLAKPPSSWPTRTANEADVLVSLDTTIGLRKRLDLPQDYIGSPILLAGFSQPLTHVTGQSTEELASITGTVDRDPIIDEMALRNTAIAIRKHLAVFDRPALAAWLHDMAFDLAPHRWWQGFLGSRHLMATSWIRAGLWDIDFGFGWKPPSMDGISVNTSGIRWAGVIGPQLDGLVTLTEAEGGHGREWWLGGVDVDIKLGSHAMERLQTLLGQWRSQRRAPRAA